MTAVALSSPLPASHFWTRRPEKGALRIFRQNFYVIGNLGLWGFLITQSSVIAFRRRCKMAASNKLVLGWLSSFFLACVLLCHNIWNDTQERPTVEYCYDVSNSMLCPVNFWLGAISWTQFALRSGLLFLYSRRCSGIVLFTQGYACCCLFSQETQWGWIKLSFSSSAIRYLPHWAIWYISGVC